MSKIDKQKAKAGLTILGIVGATVGTFVAMPKIVNAVSSRFGKKDGEDETSLDYETGENDAGSEEQSAPEEVPAEEAAPEEAPAEEAAPEETPAEEAAPEETPAEEAAPEEVPAEETAPEEAPAEEAAPEEAPAEEPAPEEKPEA